MNPYFRAVGFSSNNLKPFMQDVAHTPDASFCLGRGTQDIQVECFKAYGDGFGLLARGTMDQEENIHMTFCQPYCTSGFDLPCAYVEVEALGEDHLVVTQDMESGNEFVFLLQNTLDYCDKAKKLHKVNQVNVSGLSLNGTVLLPVYRDAYSEEMRREENDFYREMMSRARTGDVNAQELLDIQESETAEMMYLRLKEEDFLSVVEGFFVPLDDDETSYTLLGDILETHKCENRLTKEVIHRLVLDVTGTRLTLFINARDITGVPQTGMRFMGRCKLYGQLVF